MKMLGKMLIHGLLAAAVIGSAAAVYAQSKANGYLAPDATPDQRQEAVADTGNGYVRPTEGHFSRRDGEARSDHRSERHRDRHDRDHDDDDD